MGKVRTPEEVAARKAKKEAKKTAKRALVETKDLEAAASAPARKMRRGAEGTESVAAASVVAAAPTDEVVMRVASLADRLNPKRACFDAELKARWKALPKADKARLVKEDKATRGAAKKGKADGKTKSAAKGAATLPKYPFKPNPDDHCETSPAAYRDIAPLLGLVAKRLGKAVEDLEIYDPYYCSGAVKRHLAAVGFPSVYNECEDFYARLAADEIPEHDVVVSNPPYSEDAEGAENHIARLLRFCVKGGKPFILNMPEYVASAAYYSKRFAKSGTPPLLLCPYKRYHFWTPVGLRTSANKQAHHNPELGIRCSPFVSLWYVSLEPLVSHDKLVRKAAGGRLIGIEAACEEAVEDSTAPEAASQQTLARCRLCSSPGQLPSGRHTFKDER